MALDRTGPFGYTVRVLPRNELLASPAELGLVTLPSPDPARLAGWTVPTRRVWRAGRSDPARLAGWTVRTRRVWRVGRCRPGASGGLGFGTMAR